MPGKPKTPPSTEERAQITSLAASGLSQNKIARSIKRSRNLVRNVLAEPATQKAVGDERAQLSELYRGKARDVLVSINDTDIQKASLMQKSISSATLLDKSLLLSGDATVNMDVRVLVDIGAALRQHNEALQEHVWQESHAQLVPAKDCIVANCPVHKKPALPQVT